MHYCAQPHDTCIQGLLLYNAVAADGMDESLARCLTMTKVVQLCNIEPGWRTLRLLTYQEARLKWLKPRKSPPAVNYL